MAFYQEDLAYVHDKGYGNVAVNAANVLLSLIQKTDTKIISLGCGTGIFPKIVSEAGYTVLGIDYSKDMIEIARSKAPLATFEVKSFLKVKFPKVAVITAIGEVFNYLFDENNNLETLQNLFKTIYDALEEDGLFLFDVLEVGCVGEKGFALYTVQEEEWEMLLEKREDRTLRQMERSIVLYRKIGEQYRRSEEVHKVTLYKRNELKEILEQIGFQVHYLDGYDRLKFDAKKIGFLCRKSNLLIKKN